MYTKNALPRLSAHLPKNFNLTEMDVLAMMNLCPYEYALLGSSPFCSLFTEQEWKDYEYVLDMQFYGDYGFGSASGRAQGIGYILELEARLRSMLIDSSDTSINDTFDNNTDSFPLNQPLYLDMSHDNTIVSVLSALSLDYFKYGPRGLVPSVEHAPSRTFKLNEITPFGANLAFEIWTVPKSVSLYDLTATLYKNPDLSGLANTETYLRIALNSAPVPLDGLPGCETHKNGFCKVSGFLSGVETLRKTAEYQFTCFGKYREDPDQVGDGRPEV